MQCNIWHIIIIGKWCKIRSSEQRILTSAIKAWEKFRFVSIRIGTATLKAVKPPVFTVWLSLSAAYTSMGHFSITRTPLLVFLISCEAGTVRAAHWPPGSGSGYVISLFTGPCQCTHDRASLTHTKYVTQPTATIQCLLEKRPARFSWHRVPKHTGVRRAHGIPRYTLFSTKPVEAERVQVTSPIHGCNLTFKGLRRAKCF